MTRHIKSHEHCFGYETLHVTLVRLCINPLWIDIRLQQQQQQHHQTLFLSISNEKCYVSPGHGMTKKKKRSKYKELLDKNAYSAHCQINTCLHLPFYL